MTTHWCPVCQTSQDSPFEKCGHVACPAALASIQGVERWQLVPKEPTEAMLKAGAEKLGWRPESVTGQHEVKWLFRAMTAAAPAAPIPHAEGEEPPVTIEQLMAVDAAYCAAQPFPEDEWRASDRDRELIDEGWRKLNAAWPVAKVVDDNQPGRMAIIEVLKDPPTLEVGTHLYLAPPPTEEPLREALAPCAFCGGPAEIIEGDESAYVQCLDVKLHRALWFEGDNTAAEIVREHWNRRAAIAQPSPEPVAWRALCNITGDVRFTERRDTAERWASGDWTVTPLYTSPPHSGLDPETVAVCAQICEAEAEQRWRNASLAAAGSHEWGFPSEAKVIQDNKAVTAHSLANRLRSLTAKGAE